MQKKIQKIMTVMIGLFTLYCLMTLIYRLSAQNGQTSGSLSNSIYEFLKQFSFLNDMLYEWDQFVIKVLEKLNLEPLYPHLFSTYSNWQFIIRKWAHFSIYFCLGSAGLSVFTYIFNFYKGYLITLYMGVIYAFTDEIHQLFIEGRTGQITDFGIDVLGLFTALTLGLVIYIIVRIFVGLYQIIKWVYNKYSQTKETKRLVSQTS
ncbi:MAG TPA: hypothetical protein DCY20_00250 [Firmicutes bacterium]|nr:hypothetical protein [Bacillota bacterium]